MEVIFAVVTDALELAVEFENPDVVNITTPGVVPFNVTFPVTDTEDPSIVEAL